MRVLDLIADRILMLETMDESTYFFYPVDGEEYFRFEFKAKDFTEARTKAKLMYWRWNLQTKKVPWSVSVGEFINAKLEG